MQVTTQNSTVPNLRFTEFEGDWEEKKLGEISDVRDGTHDSPNYIADGFPLITSKNLMVNGSINFDDVNFISAEDYHNINKRSNVDLGDILFGMIGTIGNPVIVNDKGFAIKNVALIKEKVELLNTFLVYQLDSNSIQKQFHEQNAGGTQKFIALGLIRKLKVNTPTLPEQKKIASFLSAVDERIQKLELKKSLLAAYKKGVMRQLFSQEIRFKDDNGNNYPDWEEKKLGELIEICSSKRVLQEDWKNNGVPFLRTREIINLSKRAEFKTPIYISEILFKELKNKYGVPCYNDILATGVGTIGELYIVKNTDRFYFKDGNVLWFKMNEQLDSSYLNQIFKSRYIRKQLSDNASITTVATFTIDGARKTKIMYPSVKEQKKIASFLSGIDEKIELVETQIQQSKTFKKGLLQQMFV